jgi:Flp pilus assembly protein TadG
MRRLLKRIHEEGGENTITMILAFPLLWAIIMTIIDMGVFFNDRTLLTADLRDGARTVAIFGGTSSKDSQDLITAYGAKCSGGYATSSDTVSCLVSKKIADNKGYTAITISDINCGVDGDASNVKIGTATWCSAKYQYSGFPGSALGFMGGSFSAQAGTNVNGSWNDGTIKVSAQSEVATSN